MSPPSLLSIPRVTSWRWATDRRWAGTAGGQRTVLWSVADGRLEWTRLFAADAPVLGFITEAADGSIVLIGTRVVDPATAISTATVMKVSPEDGSTQSVWSYDGASAA